MAPGTVSVIYPAEVDGAPTKFDMDYYLKTHMPLVMKHWSPHGLKGYSVLSYPPGQPYIVQAILNWESQEGARTTMSGPDSKVPLSDIPNYTNSQPLTLTGDELDRK